MPKFQRSSYSKDLSCNVISVFDPSLLTHSSVTNCWFSGGADWHAEKLASEISGFFLQSKVGFKNVLLFGTSAGGIPSLRLAMDLPGCQVYSGNIQTLAFLHPAFKKMCPLLFPGCDEGCIVNDYAERFDARLLDGEYTLHYVQNVSDRHHYEKHYKPYRDWVENSSSKIFVNFVVYDDPAAGHSTIGRGNEILVIKQILERKSEWHSILPIVSSAMF